MREFCLVGVARICGSVRTTNWLFSVFRRIGPVALMLGTDHHYHRSQYHQEDSVNSKAAARGRFHQRRTNPIMPQRNCAKRTMTVWILGGRILTHGMVALPRSILRR